MLLAQLKGIGACAEYYAVLNARPSKRYSTDELLDRMTPLPPDVNPAQPHLVPVRKGGPWATGGRLWEAWRHDKKVGQWRRPFRVHAGLVEYETQPGVWRPKSESGTDGFEFRPPEDWTGDLPEGCCWATDFVKGQRVRDKDTKRPGVIESWSDEDSFSVVWDNGTRNLAREFGRTVLEGY